MALFSQIGNYITIIIKIHVPFTVKLILNYSILSYLIHTVYNTLSALHEMNHNVRFNNHQHRRNNKLSLLRGHVTYSCYRLL